MADADVDVIVVGAGPAGSAAALTLARSGRQVLLLERGPFPGAKNMYGGVVYPRILDKLLPAWWEEAPIQRWIVRRATMLLTDDQALTVDYRTAAWGRPPYNGATAYRPDFDAWLAGKAEDEGATLLTFDDGHRPAPGRRRPVVGVRTDRPGGDIERSARDRLRRRELASWPRRPGSTGRSTPRNYTLGVKETLALPKDVIDERFAVRGREGVDIEILGCTQGIPGGGFVYTNLDTVAVGRGAEAPHARRPATTTRGGHRRAQGPPGDRSARRGRRAEGVQRPPDPRGRAGR